MNYLVDLLCLLHLDLQQLLNSTLHNLPTFLHGTRERRQRLLEFSLHLRRDRLMCLSHALHFSPQHIHRRSQRARFLWPQWFSRQGEEFSCIFIFDRRSSCTHVSPALVTIYRGEQAGTVYQCRRPSTHHKSASHSACGWAAVRLQHLPSPKSYSQSSSRPTVPLTLSRASCPRRSVAMYVLIKILGRVPSSCNQLDVKEVLMEPENLEMNWLSALEKAVRRMK